MGWATLFASYSLLEGNNRMRDVSLSIMLCLLFAKLLRMLEIDF
jgi:hypothetical protein